MVNLIPSPSAKEFACYAVRVRSRGETVVGQTIRQKGYSVLAPTYIDRRRYADRIKRVRCALFPGYIFVRMDADQLLPIISTEGVSYIVKQGNRLVPLSSVETDALESLCASDEVGEPCTPFTPGQRVRIESGPLRGLQGSLIRVGSNDRLVISINSIFSSASIDLRNTIVQAVNEDNQ